MNGFLKGLAGFVVGAVIVGAGFYALITYSTGGLVETSDRFFEYASKGRKAKLPEVLSKAFLRESGASQLHNFLQRPEIKNYKSASWDERSIAYKMGIQDGALGGSIRLTDDSVVPVKINFIKEGEAWKLFSFHFTKAGIQNNEGPTKLPGKSALVGLARETMGTFAASIKANSMSEMYKQTSWVWQKQVKVEDLDKIYKSFFQFKGGLMVINGMTTFFTKPPYIDDDNVLHIEGYYPTTPSRITYRLKYIYEGLWWRLVGLAANVKPVKGN